LAGGRSEKWLFRGFTKTIFNVFEEEKVSWRVVRLP